MEWIIPLFTLIFSATFLLCLYRSHKVGEKDMVFSALFYGFLVEVAGTQLGLYTYPLTSLKIAMVPLAIPLAWASIIYSCIVVGRHLGLSGLGLASFSGLFAFNLDLILNPASTKAGIWTWNVAGTKMAGVPVSNYLAWALVAFFFVFFRFHLKDFIEDEIDLSIVVVASSFLYYVPLALFEAGVPSSAKMGVMVLVLLSMFAVTVRKGVSLKGIPVEVLLTVLLVYVSSWTLAFYAGLESVTLPLLSTGVSFLLIVSLLDEGIDSKIP